MPSSRCRGEYVLLLVVCAFGPTCAACAGGDGKRTHLGGEGDAEAEVDAASEDADADVGTADDAMAAVEDAASAAGDAAADGDPIDSSDAGFVCSPYAEEHQEQTSATHVVNGIDYPDPPPMGGNHDPCWLNFGVYTEERPDERWVHNLEHGGVVFLYNCPAGCAAEIAELTSLVQGRVQALLSPYAALPTKFAAVSWGYRVLNDCFDRVQLESFYTNHVDNAPESITSGPPSAHCPP